MGRFEITDEDDVEIEVGDEVVIRVSENAISGYLWWLAVTGDGLELVGDIDLSSWGANEDVGAPSEQLFRIRAIAPGPGEVMLRLKRPWEQEPVEERRLAVAVRPPSPSTSPQSFTRRIFRRSSRRPPHEG